MAVAQKVRALLHLHGSVVLHRDFRFIPVQVTSACLPRRLCTTDAGDLKPKQPANSENASLLENLSLLGVDVTMVRLRQPGVLRRAFTNEHGLSEFLKSKGASPKVISSIISRYPRAITRSIEHLEERWQLWRNIIKTDAEIVTILGRSPESFFRSSDNLNLERNIHFLTSLGLNSRDLHRMLRTAPRTFSNTVELNNQIVDFLKEICTELEGENPEQFSKAIVSRNPYILIRSTKRIRANIDVLRACLKLSNSQLLNLFQGPGAEILDLSSEYLKKSFDSLKEKMVSLGCQKGDIKKLILTYPMVLYIGPHTLSSKLDCLINGGITMKQIMEKPKVLEYSTKNITGRLEVLQRVEYDFSKNGISVLDSSQKRFDAKMGRLAASSDHRT